MKTLLTIYALTVFCWAALADNIPREPRMTLSERVAEARLVLMGKFGLPGNTGKHTTTSVEVEEVLMGSIPTNRTLFVSYTSSLWLMPDVAAYPGPLPKPGSRWIFFLTDAGVKQVPGTNYFTRAVGPHKYAHDGLELAKDETRKGVNP